jgi:hypothetical protein
VSHLGVSGLLPTCPRGAIGDDTHLVFQVQGSDAVLLILSDRPRDLCRTTETLFKKKVENAI